MSEVVTIAESDQDRFEERLAETLEEAVLVNGVRLHPEIHFSTARTQFGDHYYALVVWRR